METVKVTYRSKSGRTITSEREVKGGAVRILARDAANFVFPVFAKKGDKWRVIKGDYGTQGFNNHIEFFKGRKIYKYRDPKTAEEIKNNLAKYSSVFAAIVKWAKDHPDEVIFIYDEFVAAGGGGAINLGLVLQQHGFVWAKTSHDIRQSDPRGKKRFVVITSNPATTHQSKRIENIIQSISQPDNKYAERCQIIIGSRKIAEGITIKNVRQVHVVMPHWNISAIDQALGRVFRIGSHEAFPEDQRYIRIFRHASVKEYDKDEDPTEYNKGQGFPSNVGFSKEETMDIIVYRIAGNKEYYNTQIYRLLKEIAWDCPLAYKRNVLEGDQDGTRACDYQKCNYRCDNFPKKYILKNRKVWDYEIQEKDLLKDTYNIFYATENISEMVEKVQRLFGVYFSLRFDMIGHLIDVTIEEEKNLLLQALDFIINARIQIKNRYGLGSYLKEQGNIYFLDNVVSVFFNYPESTYITTPLVTERTSLEDLVEITQLREDKKLVLRFCKKPKENADLLQEMHYRTLVILLEKIQELRLRSTASLTSREKRVLSVVMKRLGKNLVVMPDGIVIHNMYAHEYTGLGYNVTVQEIKPTGLIRVFKHRTGLWSYVDNEEDEEKYMSRLRQIYKAQREIVWEINPYGVYGFRDRDGKFKIRVNPKPGRRATKGSVCMEASWPVLRIYALFKDIGFLPPVDPKFDKYPRENLLRDIKAQPNLSIFKDFDSKSDNELRQILSLYVMTKKDMCDALEEWFKENSLFYDYRV